MQFVQVNADIKLIFVQHFKRFKSLLAIYSPCLRIGLYLITNFGFDSYTSNEMVRTPISGN